MTRAIFFYYIGPTFIISAQPMNAIDAAALGVPETFNVATYFVDRNVIVGRGSRVAIECGDRRITYEQLLNKANRFGSALRRLGVRPEERVLLLLFDGPEFAYSFFGAIKAGAVPVPLNTLWKPPDYEHVIRNSRVSVFVVSSELLPSIEAVPPDARRWLRHIIVVGSADSTHTRTVFGVLLSQGSADLDAEPTSRDSPAFWLYSSGSTGAPKGCVRLQHDMVVCAELFGKGVLGIASTDRTFSVAKLFFAYDLGNALYFPFSVGATTILWPGPPTPEHVYAVIETHQPTLFYSVPTGYGMMLAHESCGPEGAADLHGTPAAAALHAPARHAEAQRRRAGRRTAVASAEAGQVHDFDLSSIRLAVSAGEALPAALYNRFKQRFG